MSRKKKMLEDDSAQPAPPPLPTGVVEQLVTGPMTAGDVDALFRQLKKAVLEKALGAELSHHLERERGSGNRNHRNGVTPKTLITDDGRLPIEVPRDRRARSSRFWSQSTSAVSPGSTTRSWRCMPAA